ncbi:MAG TPA: DUF4292 domain-containing protein [Bacteroidota bacterium]|nr:DUF4292 domain-containing protein [Bacteroidota bacterium]
MRFPRALCLFCLALFTSCAPKRSAVVLDTDVTSPQLLISLVETNARKLVSLVGSGVITFESPEVAGTAAFVSTLKKPDSLLVTLEGPFGIDVGTFFLSRDTYVVYNSFENTLLTGNPHRTAIRSIIPFEMTSDQILNAFAGIFPIPYAQASPTDYRIADEKFVLTYRCGANVCSYWIDPRYLLVVRYEMRDAAGDLLVQAQVSSLIEQDGVSSARRIRITFPAQQRQVSIAYDSFTLNTPETDFRYSLPANARRIVR